MFVAKQYEKPQKTKYLEPGVEFFGQIKPD